ncbi:MAG: helix-turn-helix domain-containing protein, partial [Chitinophagales bacterium]
MNKIRGTKDSQENKRKLVVSYLKKKKGTHKQAAELFELSKSAVDKIWTRYKASGLRGLTAK